MRENDFYRLDIRRSSKFSKPSFRHPNELFFNYFISISQAGELKSYFKKLGADITEEKSPKGLEDDLRKIISVCDICFKEATENEIETVLNDVVSILVVVSLLIHDLPKFRS